LQALTEQKLEMEVWQDLATIYTDLNSFLNAKACVDKAQLLEFFSPRSWHVTGMEPKETETCFFIFLLVKSCMFQPYVFFAMVTPALTNH
jgi:hypothetical protein